MDSEFRTGLKYVMIIAAVIGAGLALIVLVWQWYFNGGIVATSKNTDTAVWWEGWINGMMAVPTFIVSIFNHDYTIYRSHNTGLWYNFWYLFGAGMFVQGTSSVAGRR